MLWSFVHPLEQLQEKINQLEEQLDNEMQAKDDLEQKCKYEHTHAHTKLHHHALTL